MFIYYNERLLEHNVNIDAGVYDFHDEINSITKFGVCSDKTWVYDISKFKQKPPPNAYAEALKHKCIKTYIVPQTFLDIRNALISNYPLIFCMAVYDNIYNVGHDGMFHYPILSRDKIIGYHCVVIVGYNDVNCTYKIRNSWSASWGDGGYFYVPYSFILNPNLCSNLWIIVQET